MKPKFDKFGKIIKVESVKPKCVGCGRSGIALNKEKICIRCGLGDKQ